MSVAKNRQKRGLKLKQSMMALTGAFMSLGAKVAPKRFASMLVQRIFTPIKMKSPERAENILRTALMKTHEVEGNQIVHYVWGDSGKCVLLVHGWSGNASQMTAVAEQLIAAGFKVVAIDFPGHGRSTGKKSSVLHFERVIANAKSFYGPFHAIVAHSLGAAATTYALARGMECKYAVFFSPLAKYSSVWVRTQQLMGISPKLMNLAVQRAQTWLNIAFEDIEPIRLAPRLSTNLLVIHDKQDRECPIADSEELVRMWPNAELVSTDRLGHTRILGDPDTVQLAKAFILGAEGWGAVAASEDSGVAAENRQAVA